MVHEIKDRNLSDKFRRFVKSQLFIPVLLLLFIVITVPVVYLITSKPVDIRQRAADAGMTATIDATPSSGNVSPGQSFTVDVVVDGGDQQFNAAQATIGVSNLTIQSVSITPIDAGGCNFTFANQSSTPSVSNLSFAGAILNGSSSRCTVYTVTLVAGTEGSSGITISNGQVKSLADNSEIFLSSQNAIFTVTTTPADPIPQSVMYLTPAQASVTTGQNFAVDVRIDTNGQMVNAVETDISYPTSLLNVVSVSDQNGDFPTRAVNTFANGTISIAYGSITPKSGDLQVVRITFQTLSGGISNVDFSNTVIVSSQSNTDVFKNSTGGIYNAIWGDEVTPTLAPTIPNPSFPPSTPVLPSPTPTNIPVPTSTVVPPTPTRTPTPTTIQPTVTPTPVTQILVSVSNTLSGTYTPTQTLNGTKSVNATQILINNSAIGVTYPSATTWQFTLQLIPGQNAISIYAQDENGNKSSTITTSIRLHRLADINGDDLIDLTDLSMFGTDWEKTSSLNHLLSDMNSDGVVNLTDFSIFAKAYGN